MKALVNMMLCAVLFAASCSNGMENDENGLNFNLTGLEGRIIWRLDKSEKFIFAATDEGLYKRSRFGGAWELIGFEGIKTQAITVFSDTEIIVSTYENNDASLAAVHHTTNGGETWQIKHPSGESDDSYGAGNGEPMFNLVQDPGNPNTLYSTGTSVVAKSYDRGDSWMPVYGDWGGFATGLSYLGVNPQNTSEVWAGGQNAIEGGILLKSEDGGESWREWFGLVSNPTTVKSALFHGSGDVFVGFEGALIKTEDGGISWKTLIHSEENRFFFGIVSHPDDPSVLYAGGWLKRFDEPQPLIIYKSSDKGDTWEEINVVGVEYGGIYDMLVEPGSPSKIYLGLYKGGVYEMELN